MHPVDQLHFRPEMMDNSIGSIKTEVDLSLATMGQDQRHRTLRRGKPRFTGDFYLPPLLKELKLENKASEMMKKWIEFHDILPSSLWTVLAPYGAIVKYTKQGSFNALAHEQAKRLCWCAQEEIYHLSRTFRLQIIDRFGIDHKLISLFEEPACYNTGICVEGGRFCGRDIK